MAGLPPLLGFVGKEAAFDAFLVDGRWLVVLGLLAGSVLTVAYSARFLWGAFATKPGREPTWTTGVSPGLTVPVALPALAGRGLPGRRRPRATSQAGAATSAPRYGSARRCSSGSG